MREPMTTAGRIHHLNAARRNGPQDDEMSRSVSAQGQGNGRQRVRLGQEQMVLRDQHLFRDQAEILCEFLQRIDRRSVDLRLTGLSQSAIAHRDTETVKHALQRSRATVDIRGLKDLWSE